MYFFLQDFFNGVYWGEQYMPMNAEEFTRSPGTGVMNLSLLMEQQAFLSAELTLQPPQCVSKAQRGYIQNLK